MTNGTMKPEVPPSSPDTPVSAKKTVPPSPPLTSSSPSLSPLPQSLLSRPALPRSVASAFRHLQQAHLGQYTGPSWVQFSNVYPDDLEALIAVTKPFKYRFRFDYEPLKRQLTLRMPEGTPHIYTKNGFAQSFLNNVKDCLYKAIQEQGARADADVDTNLGSIRVTSNVEAKVEFPDGGIRRPDVAFCFKGSLYPPLVIEVGHSQKASSLATLARDYLSKTNGAIHTVITARFVHLGPEQRRLKRRQAREHSQPLRRTTRSQTQEGSDRLAHISLYRLGKRVIHDQEFRDAEGRPRDGGLALSIADFVPWDGDGDGTARARLEGLTFTVPFSELCDALAWGEEQQALEEQTPAPDADKPVMAGQKRVHFEWSEPEPDHDTDETDNTNTDAEEDSRAVSSSKRRRISDADTPYCPDRPEAAAGSGEGQQGEAVMAHRRRRSSSRLRQHATQGAQSVARSLIN